MEMNWYTAYTEPNLEKKVTATLTRKQITHFCPVEVISRQENKKLNQSFSCYIFVKVSEAQVKELKQIRGIKHLMYWMDKPAVVPEFEIDLIKNFLTAHSYVKLETIINASTYTTGAQKENEAKLIHLNDNKVKAILPSLKLVMIAEFEKTITQFPASKNVVTHIKPKFNYKIAGNS